jgi:hypothetical protein
MVLEVEQKGSMGSVIVLVKTFVTQVEKILMLDRVFSPFQMF